MRWWVLAAAIAMVSCQPAPSEWTVLGTLERDRIELTADSSEPIQTVLVKEGELVEIDQPLIAQNTDRVRATLDRAYADEAGAAAVLAEAERGPRAQAIAQGRARYEAALSARSTARHEYERQVSLHARGFSSLSLVDVLKGRFDEAVSHADEAKAALEELQEGTRNEKIDQARSLYQAAKAAVRNLEISLARATVRSPVRGIVETIAFEVGERPPIAAPIVVVLAESPIYARVHIPELLRVRVTPETPAHVTIDGYDRTWPARVRWVASQAAFTPYYALTRRDRSRLSFLAEIDLTDDEAQTLPSGVPVEVVFPDIVE